MFGLDFFFFFFHVAISDSVQWLPYLGFVPGPTRTTSKGLMSLLFLPKMIGLKYYKNNISTGLIVNALVAKSFTDFIIFCLSEDSII